MLHPNMCKAIGTVNPQNPFDLAKEVDRPHIDSSFVVACQRSQIFEDVRLCVYPSVRLNPLKIVIQKGSDCLLITPCKGLRENAVCLRIRLSLVSSENPGCWRGNSEAYKYESYEPMCKSASHCLLSLRSPPLLIVRFSHSNAMGGISPSMRRPVSTYKNTRTYHSVRFNKGVNDRSSFPNLSQAQNNPLG